MIENYLKEEEYIYEPFKSEDVDFWIKGGVIF